MTTCPNCQKPVDPLRARSVGVRDGKVVAYCSAACAEAAEPKRPRAATPRAATPPIAAPKASLADYDSGPVIEVIHEPASGVVTSAPDRRDPRPESEPGAAAAPAPAPRAKSEPVRERRDSVEVARAEDWLDDEPAEPVRGARATSAAEEFHDTPPRSRFGIVLVVLILLGGAGWAVYRYVYLPRTAATASASVPAHRNATPPATAATGGAALAAAATQAEVPAPPPARKDAARDRALGVLRKYLTTEGSPRLQRAAAIALARTGDPAAIARLVTAFTGDGLEPAGKLEVAYALARAGDARGTDVLVSTLRVPSRDERLTAARLLAQLRDERAVPTLAGFLEVSQHRLSAAGQLARFADPRAIEVLEQIRKDRKASLDDKATAAIALAVAGKREVVDEIRALLDDRRFNLFAADALAALHDEAARPVLEGQLELSQLRVRAARALRRLAPDRDPTPYLTKLVAMLDDPARRRDTEELPTAEAILLLAGPATWSERP